MLADEAEHAAPVPERPPREEALVGRRVPAVARRRPPARTSAPSRPSPRGSRGRSPRRTCGSPRRSRRARRASRAGAGGSRRASSPPAPARSAARRGGSGRAGARAAGSRRRSGVRRTSVPRTVGKRRRDGCHEPSGSSELRPGDAAARVRGHEVAERRDAPGSGTRVRVRDEHELAARRGDAGVDVRGEAQRPRRSRSHARAERVGGLRAREVGDHDAPRRPAAGARAASSRAPSRWPCETTTAETFMRCRAPRGRRRRVRRAVSSHENAPRALEPGCAKPLALGDRLADAVGEPAGLDEHRRVARDLAQRRVGRGDDGRARRHRLEHRQAEALVARRQTRHAAPR